VSAAASIRPPSSPRFFHEVDLVLGTQLRVLLLQNRCGGERVGTSVAASAEAASRGALPMREQHAGADLTRRPHRRESGGRGCWTAPTPATGRARVRCLGVAFRVTRWRYSVDEIAASKGPADVTRKATPRQRTRARPGSGVGAVQQPRPT